MANTRKYFPNQKFYRLTLLKEIRHSNPIYNWLCLCECGNHKMVRISDVKAGKVRSCGCLVSDRKIIRNRKEKLIHQIFHAMKARCYNRNNKQYKDYGGRGVMICQDWLKCPRDFMDWAISNGWKEGLQIDKDIKYKEKHGTETGMLYSPEYCCFVTQTTNSRNTRNNKLITYNDKTRCLSEWCEELGLSYKRSYDRLTRLNWPIEKIFLQNK